jgi:hypothetical protein
VFDHRLIDRLGAADDEALLAIAKALRFLLVWKACPRRALPTM